MVSEPFDSIDAEFRKRVYETLARHESRFNLLNKNINQVNNNLHQIHSTLQTILTELQILRVNRNGNTVKEELNPFILVETVHSTTISPPTQISTTTHITPHHTINDQKIVKKNVQLQVLQVAVRDLDRFQYQNLPTSSCATASVADKPVVAIHLNTWTAATLPTLILGVDRLRSSSRSQLMVFPLPVFDPGGD